MLLLNLSALIVVTFARSASRSTQAAQLTTTSWALTTNGVENAVASPCGSGDLVGIDRRQQIVVEWAEQERSGWRERDLQVAAQSSALVGAAPIRLAVRAAWSCP